MKNHLVLLNEFLPPSAVGLGWLADSIKNPTMDAHETKPPLSTEAIMRTVGSNFEALASASHKNEFRLSLTRLINNSTSFENAGDTKLSSLQVTKYQLRQPRAVFQALVKDEQARTWLNESIAASRKAYLVVELQTATNPSLSTGNTKTNSVGVDLTVPVSTIASGGIDVLGLGDQLDSSIGGGSVVSREDRKSFTMEGEHIFAIGFKRVLWSSLGLRKNVDKAKLDDKITWSVFGEKRGLDDEEVMEANLTDELDTRATDSDEVDIGDDDSDEDDDDVAGMLSHAVDAGDEIYLI